MTAAILQMKRATKLYANGRGIRDVSLELRAGDVYGLLGPNGAGKTTILKLMTGLIRAKTGSISLFGYDITEHFEKAMRPVGCMIESADFHDFLNASQYLRMVAYYYPYITEKKIDETLEQVGLLNVRKDKIKHYSTGMKQKLALAAAVLPDPKLVILDEPTNGLDIEGTVIFRNVVKRLAEEKGTAFIISSHMIHELEQLCSRIGIVFEGALRKEGNVSELLLHNQSLESFYIDELQKARKGNVHA
ncbi:ABC transporter ATP-binding protein [Paenibacillus contaminans]|uniref:ABC transporter ATP-binding protein n=1 Tax=Paenibacillus contaminans TaxID=450362 RepID=A0A329M8U4_9BACL|nr:ABC transporter ATP-binding protein [Paenibacillus contaminans]RAV16395.1 ABC transporter ATP-binding protein [Paenibacillus contaminans]